MDDIEFNLLKDAAKDTDQIASTASKYVKVRKLLADGSLAAEKEFRVKFSVYYGLNAAGLSDKWRERYFKLLFSFRERMPDEPHRLALQKLFQIKRRQGDKALQFSFVSKLVGILDERQPIFDQYVQHYFGLGPPSLMALPEFRISGFLRNLAEIHRRYEAWSDDGRFAASLRGLQTIIPDLAQCHPVRICDFLVWSVGKRYKRRDAETEV
jgi:hypothetical protein